MIRVGFVMHIMQVAGAEVLVVETIARLKTRIQPVVFCLDGVGALGEQLRREGVDVVTLDRQPGFDWRVARRLAAEVAARDIQVLHAHQYTPFFYAALAKGLRGVRPGGARPRLIHTEHGRHYPDIVSSKRRVMNRLVFDRLADRVNAVCQFSAEALAEKDGFRGDRIEVIENGIDLSRYRPTEDRTALRLRLGLDPSRLYVANVARLHPVKDQATLVRAFADVAARLPDADLLLVGDGALRASLEQQVQELGLRDRVRFLGVRRDVPDLLHAIDLFTLTSVSEAASITLLEAMGCGRAVVATRVGGNPEIVRDEVDGLLVPRGDAAALAEALAGLLVDRARRETMGRAGAARVRERFTIERTVHRYYDLYQALAGRA